MPAFNQTLNLDSIEPVGARTPRTVVQSSPVSASADTSPLFPAAPVYARTAPKKASNNMALLVGAPVVLVAAGAIAWAMMANPTQTPSDQSAQMAVADTPAPVTQPVAPAAATPAPIPTPFETAAVETAAPRAASPAPVRAAPRAAAARRAAPVEATTPNASTASSNVSATVPAPVAIVPEPTPLVIPAPTAPAPTPAPVTPITPM